MILLVSLLAHPKNGSYFYTGPYETREAAIQAIEALEEKYKATDYYAGHEDQIGQAVQTIKTIYDQTFFHDQKVDWTTYPNNIGHIYSPGCFRCHDGKHLNSEQQAIRLECNVCHSIPTVASEQDFVSTIEISHGPEPETHLNPNWIAMHHDAFNYTCADCHTTDDPGGTSNTSFCSNSACHGNVYLYAGFNAPALREILAEQLPPPPPPLETPAPVVGTPTFQANILPLFRTKCSTCHGETDPQKGLDLTSYAGLMAGSSDGPMIVAGDSAGSKLVQVQSGQHFATFTPEELDWVIQWIDAGALDD